MIRIKAKRVAPGIAKGTALVTRMPISFTGGVDPDTGVVREPGHELEGQSIAGKILVFPSGKGSTTGSWQYYATYRRGNAPVGIINVKAEGVVAVSAVITGTPMVHELEINPLDLIRSGDRVTLNADEGFVEIEQAACSRNGLDDQHQS
jgi:predicted aconitase with swiveling domain